MTREESYDRLREVLTACTVVLQDELERREQSNLPNYIDEVRVPLEQAYEILGLTDPKVVAVPPRDYPEVRVIDSLERLENWFNIEAEGISSARQKQVALDHDLHTAFFFPEGDHEMGMIFIPKGGYITIGLYDQVPKYTPAVA